MTSVFSWQNSCQPFPCLILYSEAKSACYSRYFLTSYFCIPVPYNEKDIFFWLLILEGLIGLLSLVGLHRTVQLQLLQHYWSGIDLGYCDIEWFALEMNRDHSVIFQIASSCCILDSFVNINCIFFTRGTLSKNAVTLIVLLCFIGCYRSLLTLALLTALLLLFRHF